MKYLFFLTLLLASINSYAVWINTSGTVESIITYSGRETILVGLSSDGTDVEDCSSKTTFAISKDMSEEGRARMYSMLLTAKTTGETVTLSYSDTGGCEEWDSNTNVYRRIVRLR